MTSRRKIGRTRMLNCWLGILLLLLTGRLTAVSFLPTR